MNLKKLVVSAVCLAAAAFFMASCGKDISHYGVPLSDTSSYSENSQTEIGSVSDDSFSSSEQLSEQSADSSKAEAIKHDMSKPRTVVMTEENVKLLGRTALLDDVLWCTMSGTGVEFEFTGKRLDVTLLGGESVKDVTHHHPRVGIYVDGERVADELLGSEETVVNVFKSKKTKTVNVRIVKLSESEMSVFGIKPVEVDAGEDIVPAGNKPHTIEFIGDSITCGYGVDDPDPNHNFSTATEDITKTFAEVSAKLLNADYSVFAASGYGVYSGFSSDGNRTERELIPNYYETLGYSASSLGGEAYPQDISWDFSSFQPEVIVINLGTNDSTYCGSSSERLKEFENAYADFLKTVRDKNPEAEIFCILGTLSSQIWSGVKTAAEKYSEETGDEKVHWLLIDSHDGELGYAADWHPTEDTQYIMAESLYENIMDVMQW